MSTCAAFQSNHTETPINEGQFKVIRPASRFAEGSYKRLLAVEASVRKIKPAEIGEGVEVSPDQIIPLDDKDFKGF